MRLKRIKWKYGYEPDFYDGGRDAAFFEWVWEYYGGTNTAYVTQVNY